MFKIKEVTFKDHPVMGNLHIDFRTPDGSAANTVIIAGENGCGKSTVIDSLYQLMSHGSATIDLEANLVLSTGEQDVNLDFHKRDLGSQTLVYVSDELGMNTRISSEEYRNRYPTTAIYSDVDINFTSDWLTSVTSMELDKSTASRKSTNNLPSEINQLLIDIQALDDADVAYAARSDLSVNPIAAGTTERMPRFTSAFNIMFDNLSYDRIENDHGHKVILFKKNGIDIPIDALSSGEKQIVYRGCFMLKDANATAGAFVFIDEPEISLHPSWQLKIMDYYTKIFTNADGMQTSQVFAVTHSPFIVHNGKGPDTKVVVLKRDENGALTVSDNPEYYKFGPIEAIEDAFSLNWQRPETPVVYLEGETDERYFNATIEAFGLMPAYEFKWIGTKDSEGHVKYTGEPALRKAVEFLVANPRQAKTVCLFDCDTRRPDETHGTVRSLSLPQYDNLWNIKKGVENALVLDSVDREGFYSSKQDADDYGAVSTISSLDKLGLCNYICSLDNVSKQKVLVHLFDAIQQIDTFFQ